MSDAVFWSVVFVVGALGTTYFSPLMNDFIFTWPVCLFAAFQSLIDRIALKHKHLTVRERLKSGVACLGFLAVCLLYFLVCRRLSLVFEWVFLGGFFAAVPLSLAARYLFVTRRWYLAWQVLATGLAFTAFYWSSVAFLYVRVR